MDTHKISEKKSNDVDVSSSTVSVDFLREQHSVVLSGLQVEIEKLRKTCSDLQFQLVFDSIKRTGSASSSKFPDDNDDVETSPSSSVHSELLETCRTCQELRVMIGQQDLRIRQQEERYQEDIGARNLIVARLRKEVQEKKNTISNLVKLIRVRPDHRTSGAGVNLNRDEILRRAEAQIGTVEQGPLLTVFSPKAGRSSASTSTSRSKSTLSDLGKQLVEKYCGASRLVAGSPVAGNNGNLSRRPGGLMRSVSGSSTDINGDDTGQMSGRSRPAPVAILEPWSPHQSNGTN